MMPMQARKSREELTLLAMVLQSGGEHGGMHALRGPGSVQAEQAEQGGADVVGHRMHCNTLGAQGNNGVPG